MFLEGNMEKTISLHHSDGENPGMNFRDVRTSLMVYVQHPQYQSEYLTSPPLLALHMAHSEALAVFLVQI